MTTGVELATTKKNYQTRSKINIGKENREGEYNFPSSWALEQNFPRYTSRSICIVTINHTPAIYSNSQSTALILSTSK